MDAAVNQVRDQLGPPTILVNNAGISPFKRFMDISRDDFEEVSGGQSASARSSAAKRSSPCMIEAHWGRIINIASSSAQTGQPPADALLGEQGRSHRLHSIAGSRTRTQGRHGQRSPSKLHRHARVSGPRTRMEISTSRLSREMIPVRRVGAAEDIAAMCAFLARDDASYVTGQVLGVNGGRVMQ